MLKAVRETEIFRVLEHTEISWAENQGPGNECSMSFETSVQGIVGAIWAVCLLHCDLRGDALLFGKQFFSVAGNESQ